VDRRVLGQAGLGHVVGVGRAADLGADPAVPVPRLHRAGRGDRRRGARDKAGALLAIVGAVNVPIIYFSVRWWNTLHQGATISMTAAPKMASTMLLAMLLMTFAFWAYAFAVVFMRHARIVLEREREAAWVRGSRAARR
jgi:heme exporter protein C